MKTHEKITFQTSWGNASWEKAQDSGFHKTRFGILRFPDNPDAPPIPIRLVKNPHLGWVESIAYDDMPLASAMDIGGLLFFDEENEIRPCKVPEFIAVST